MKRGNHEPQNWSIDDADELYGVRHWGVGYFDISDRGEVIVRPRGDDDEVSVSLCEIVEGVKERGLDMPVLLRLGDILDSRIKLLHETFQAAISEAGYQGVYRGVYPIKVNQQQQVIEEITRFGRAYHHGLEAGSKAELIAAISYLQDREAYLICNGYKDEEFVDLGLYALQMGVQCVFVVETPGELEVILDRSEKLDIRPIIGIRVKLSTQGVGHWSESGGDRSVFGLNTAQIVDVVEKLREKGMLDCLQMLHYHLGSQIPNIRDIRESIVEASRYYVGLVKEGAPMGVINLGGGLAVDYDGSHTNFESSCNYTLKEYCADIVEVLKATLDEEDITHPIIITESGRATVAYYSVLLFNILDVSQFESHGLPGELPEDVHDYIRKLREVETYLNRRNLQECYHDLVYYRGEIRQLFKHGAISLRESALAEQIFWHLLSRIAREVKKLKYIPDEFEQLDSSLSDYYYGNFSVFQSLPDSWAIDQLFPVMPIHRLNERPTRHAILADITCDCDGKLDRFIDLRDVKHTLAVHEWSEDQEYILGVFLVGAYQETLGDLHNLLGDTNVVTVRIDEDGRVQYANELEGDSVADVLSYVEYDPKTILVRLRNMAERAVQEGRMSGSQRREVMQTYEAGLRGYTYFER